MTRFGVETLLLVGAILLPFGGTAHRKTEQGNARYGEGQYEDALRLYTEAQVDAPHAAELFYDIGNVLYREGDYEGAAEAYTRALLAAPQELVAPAAFNLGNSRFRLEAFDEAVDAYERALRADPEDLDAKRNLELALLALERQPPDREQEPRPSNEEEPDEGEGRQQQGQRAPEGERGEGERPRPTPGDEGAAGQDRGDEARAQTGRMTEEDAQRLLDGLEEQELEHIRDRLLKKIPAPKRTAEEDW